MTPAKTDPSRTGSIRRAYEAEFMRRIDTVRRFVYRALVTQDAIGLKSPARHLQVRLPNPRQWATLPPNVRARQFGQWLLNLVDDAVLQGQDLVGPTGPGQWMRTFIRRAYFHGVTTTTTSLRRMGREIADQTAAQIMQSRFHRSRLESLYDRNLDELRGFTANMGTELKRIIADGLLRGTNPKTLASDISKRLEITRNRARTIARTEVIRANSEATLSTFEQFGERDVQLDAEWVTAGDDRVCPLCEPNEGRIFPVDEARGMIPLHPNCRCDWIPVQQEERQVA